MKIHRRAFVKGLVSLAAASVIPRIARGADMINVLDRGVMPNAEATATTGLIQEAIDKMSSRETLLIPAGSSFNIAA